MTTDTNAGPVLPPPDAYPDSHDGAPHWRWESMREYAEQVAGPLRERIAELEQEVEHGGERHNGTWVAMLAECRARGSEIDRLRAEIESRRECWNALQSLSRHVERMREAGLVSCDDVGPEHWARELLTARAAREGE
jgi:hypothetical protein